jgi:sugar phosphate permease
VTDLQWTIDAYTLVIACLLMLSGSLADRFGRRRVFQAGLVLFSLGSLLCSLAPGLGWLVAFRALQAVGGSMLNPVAMAIIVNTFTDRKERARATGVWGSVVGVSLAAGPVIGGLLVSAASCGCHRLHRRHQRRRRLPKRQPCRLDSHRGPGDHGVPRGAHLDRPVGSRRGRAQRRTTRTASEGDR